MLEALFLVVTEKGAGLVDSYNQLNESSGAKIGAAVAFPMEVRMWKLDLTLKVLDKREFEK